MYNGDVIIIVFFFAVADFLFAVVSIGWYVIEWRGDIAKGDMAYSLDYSKSEELFIFDFSSALFSL